MTPTNASAPELAGSKGTTEKPTGTPNATASVTSAQEFAGGRIGQESTVSQRSFGSPFDLVVGKLGQSQPTARGVRARCPAHDDHKPSLDVDRGDDGRVLMVCRSRGCSSEAITSALGLTMADLFPPKSGGRPMRAAKPVETFPTADDATRALIRAVETFPTADDATRALIRYRSKKGGKFARHHDYHAADGTHVGRVVRFDYPDGNKSFGQKSFGQQCLDGTAWVLKAMPVPRPIFRLPELMAAGADEIVLVVEGEKCAEQCAKLGFVATSSPGGSAAPDKADWAPLKGRRVVILPDHDEPGRKYMQTVVREARAAGSVSVAVLELDGLKDGEDVVDWIDRKEESGTATEQIAIELRALVDAAPAAEVEPDVALPKPKRRSDREPAESPPLAQIGQVDLASNQLVLSTSRTLATAEAFVRQFHTHPEGRTVHSCCGQILAWRDNRFAEVEEEALRHQLHPWLTAAAHYVVNRNTGQQMLVPFPANPGTTKAALETIRAHVHLPASTESPSWLTPKPGDYPADEIVACRSKNLHVPTSTLLDATPRLFARNALEFDFDARAPEPQRWQAFLEQLFGEDQQSIDLLQEWFGYCLTADTAQQKMLLVVGPRRSGKGTIARVLTQLLGAGNVCGPTVSSLAGNFGLQPLLGKSLAIVSDARFSGENVATVVERLLCISGEDRITVDRKFLESVTVKLGTRFVFLTNELPRFNDSSAALAGRFLILRLTRSHYGTEDTHLTRDLLAELPGILVWALDGWRRLHDRGRFVEPASSAAAVQDIADLSSPVGAFIRERCIVGAGHRVGCAELYAAWIAWCLADGRNSHSSAQTFGRDLSAASSGVSRRRCTGRPPFYEGINLHQGETP